MSFFPFYRQLNSKDCGPTCLYMITQYYGKTYPLQTLREYSHISREGVSLLDLSEAAEKIGMKATGLRLSIEQLKSEIPLPCILHWERKHFVVCYKIQKKRDKYHFFIADPAKQLLKYSEDEMKIFWIQQPKEKGIVLTLEPKELFFQTTNKIQKGATLRTFFKYVSPYKKQLYQLILGMACISIIQLILPFLTQALVDIGLNKKDFNLITLILIAQIILSISRLSVEFIRSWILLHTNAKISIALISDYLIKLMNLPLQYFDSKLLGDIMQRIKDHGRIRHFLMGSTIGTIFSLLTSIIFIFILASYNSTLLFILFIGNSIHICWIVVFLKKRRELDIKRFEISAKEQSKIIQLINAIQEIKLNNCEKKKRWQWERLQVELFKINTRGLFLGQIQQTGSFFCHQTCNIIITYLTAKYVINGQMTLGMMMSLNYIIGQLNAPILHFISFIQHLQDAHISLERLNEIHEKTDEEEGIEQKVNKISIKDGLQLEHVSFSYNGSNRNYILNDISTTIPINKTTAIVGASGSGKTTLIKLIMGFYAPNKGHITIGDTLLNNINPHIWRSKIGAVMQDGYIFSESIAENIAVSDNEIDIERLKQSARLANIEDFINTLPLKYETQIGIEGIGISQGQKQRILIARAIYKSPEIIFFDEATNALDSNNEKEIMGNLKSFFKGKTIIIAAHRLSTITDADKIIVLDKGYIIEEGNHQELIKYKGVYYHLVQRQLELVK